MRKHLVISSAFSSFLSSPSTGKPRQTPLSSITTTESYMVAMVTISRETSYNSGILRQENGITRGLPRNHMSWIVHLPEQSETCVPNCRIGPHYGPCIAAIAGYIFFYSCDIREYILRNKNFSNGLDSYSRSSAFNLLGISDTNQFFN